MTIDGTYFARGDSAAKSDADMIEGDLDVAAVQLAVADAAQITLPHGQPVVVVPVTPGETVQLPTDTTDHLLAELGPQGNLLAALVGYVTKRRFPKIDVTDDASVSYIGYGVKVN